MTSKGKVYLVGAGPGDPGLLTLRGAEWLGKADVVIYDGLVNPEILRRARSDAEIIYAGKHDRTRAVSQEETNALLVARARAGKRVVRLKGGDPYVFARGGEEAERLADAGIDFEVIPGVSSAEAVPCYAGIPLTHRDYCSSYTVVTGHQCVGEPGSKVDWPQIATVKGTLVVLMGLKQMPQIVEALVSHGRSPDTPAAMIRWGTTGRQQSIAGTLGTLVELANQAQIQPPVVTVIGEVVKLRDKLNWFERLPLLGQRLVVTRSREQAGALAHPLRALGAEVWEIPTIKFTAASNLEPLREAMTALNAYDWVVFTSVNGVNAFFDHFFHRFHDLRDFGGARIAAVGSATAARLQDLHLQVDVTPDEYRGAQIAGAMNKIQSLENTRILLLRAEVAHPELPRLLEDLGAIVDDIPCYRTVPDTDDITGAARQLTERGADWITFTSGSTVTQFHARFELRKLCAQFPSLRLASIGPETSKAIEDLGLKPALEAKPHTVEGLLAALEQSRRPKGRRSTIKT
jgi:uroporphyrinogen III methyltransferase / synthase